MLGKHWISHLRLVGSLLAAAALAACGGGGGGGGGSDGGSGSSDEGTVTNISLPYSSTLSGGASGKITFNLLLSASSDPVSVWTTGGFGSLTLSVINPQGQTICQRSKVSGENVNCAIGTPTTGTWKLVVAGAGNGSLSSVGFTALSGTPVSSLPHTSSTLTGVLNSNKDYTFAVPVGTTAVRAQLSGGTGNANIRLVSPTGKICESLETNTNVEDCAFNNPRSGVWRVRVIGTAAYNGATLSINTSATMIAGRASDTITATVASEPFPLTEQTAKALTNLSGLQDSTQNFNFTVAASVSTITARLSGGTGDADIYVFNTVGNGAVCRTVGTGNTETCTILNPEPGTWSVVVFGYEAFSGANLSLTASSN